MPETPANAREPIRHLWTIRRDAAVDRALERRNTVTLKGADRATLDVQGLLSVDRKGSDAGSANHGSSRTMRVRRHLAWQPGWKV
ncbi:hypothetical protein, partial [Iamia sp.]|uniref:hypothetical protein n=1 Tax=Iamia sp. TaxID=2722710 RepID=UPI002C4AFC4E